MMNILYLGIFDVGGTNLEGTLSELSSLLLELLNSTGVNTTALVDLEEGRDVSIVSSKTVGYEGDISYQVTSSGRLAGIDVADNDNVNVSTLVLTHGDGRFLKFLCKILGEA
jgi:hypothetical protein